MLYIVNSRIYRYHYLGSTDTFDEMNIVEAASTGEAEDKVREQYKKKDAEYSVFHQTETNYINKLIK